MVEARPQIILPGDLIILLAGVQDPVPNGYVPVLQIAEGIILITVFDLPVRPRDISSAVTVSPQYGHVLLGRVSIFGNTQSHHPLLRCTD